MKKKSGPILWVLMGLAVLYWIWWFSQGRGIAPLPPEESETTDAVGASVLASPLQSLIAIVLLLITPLGARGQLVNRSAEGMVSAGQPLAAEAGARMLAQGGNAVDAAVAAAWALAVVEPSMSGIGGRAQILIRLPDGTLHGIDATTQAPATYDPDTAPQGSYGYPTVGVPGVPAGLLRAHDEFGVLPRDVVMAHAIQLAAEGFTLLPGEARRHAAAARQLSEFEGSRSYFLRPDFTPHRAGDRLVQSDLAGVLRAIAEGGHDAFYSGPIAEQMVRDLQSNGAAVTLESLAAYRVETSRIVRGEYRGIELAGLWMPSFGAITIHALHLLETIDLEDATEAEWAAAVAEALRVAYLERPNQAGWDDAERLVSKEWAVERAALMRLPAHASVRAGVDEGRADLAEVLGIGRSDDFRPPPSWTTEPGHTTHLSATDAQGGMVALTQTLGPNMGSKVAAPGLGFLYAATLGGYLGRMEGGQRAASHISPLFLFRDGQPWVTLGAAGGGRIPTAIVAAVSRMVDGGLPVHLALRAPRVVPLTGSAFEPGDPEAVLRVDLEANTGLGFSDEVIAEFESLGFEARRTSRSGAFGRIHAIQWDAEEGVWIGAADPDWEGAARAPGDFHFEGGPGRR